MEYIFLLSVKLSYSKENYCLICHFSLGKLVEINLNYHPLAKNNPHYRLFFNNPNYYLNLFKAFTRTTISAVAGKTGLDFFFLLKNNLSTSSINPLPLLLPHYSSIDEPYLLNKTKLKLNLQNLQIPTTYDIDSIRGG